MTDEKLQILLQLLNDQYRNAAPAITKNTVKLWKDCLSEYDDDLIDKAMKECIKTNRFCPTIAEIIEKANAINEEYEALVFKIHEVYKEMIDRAPANEDVYGTYGLYEEIIAASTMTGTLSNAKKVLAAYRLQYRSGNPSLLELLKGLKVMKEHGENS